MRTHKENDDQYPFERFASIRRYTNFDFLKQDPSWMIYIVDTSGQFNLWRQRSTLNREEGEINAAHQLTTFVDDPVRQVFTSPKDNTWFGKLPDIYNRCIQWLANSNYS